MLSEFLKSVTTDLKDNASDAVDSDFDDTLLTLEERLAMLVEKDSISSLVETISENTLISDVFRISMADDNKSVRERSRSLFAVNEFTRANKSLVCKRADLVLADSKSTDSFKLSTPDAK